MRKMAQCHSVIEVGSGKPFGKELASYCQLFENCDWKTLDICPEINPNIVDDITRSKIATASVEGVICKSIFEHIAAPQMAAEEIYRILVPGGRLFSYIPFLHSYHPSERYQDYFRFTEDGIRQLFHQFRLIKLCPSLPPILSVLALSPIPIFMRNIIYVLLMPLDAVLIRKGWFNKLTSGYYVYAKK